MLSYVTESPVILDRPLSRTTLFVFLLYTASNKNVKQSIHVLHTDSFISHTFGKWQKTCYTFCTPSYNRRQSFVSIHSIAKNQKSKSDFLYFNRHTMYLYYITQSSVLCYWNFITNSSCKKSQNHFLHMVSSNLFRPVPSTRYGQIRAK